MNNCKPTFAPPCVLGRALNGVRRDLDSSPDSEKITNWVCTCQCLRPVSVSSSGRWGYVEMITKALRWKVRAHETSLGGTRVCPGLFWDLCKTPQDVAQSTVQSKNPRCLCPMCPQFYLFIFNLFILEGKGMRKKGRETSMCGCLWCASYWGDLTWPTMQAFALTGNQTSNPLVLRPALNPLSYTSQSCL